MSPNRNISQKGAFLLPNLLTTGALFAGFFSIIAGIKGHASGAAIAIIVAAVLDGLDGRVARLTNTQSDFGLQYDSLADLVSFGLAPALLAYNWSLRSLADLSALSGKLGWLAAFIYVACAALRLARFNSQAGTADKTYFQGLASPAAALTLVVTIWFFVDNHVGGDTVRWLILVVTAGLGVLMFSRIRYFSFKNLPVTEKVPITWIFLLVLGIVLLSVDPPAVTMACAWVYVASGLLLTLIGRRNRLARRARRRFLLKQRRARQEAAGEGEPGGDEK